ncbi:MAG: GNAT family N-acetyltransferase [Simplicispira sp.]|nr:GNAT family N-acetyltransferase [Simplicispira sp.]
MTETKDWLKTSWDAGMDLLRPTGALSSGASRSPLMIPIRSLGPHHRERIAQHLLKLAPADRYLRFGYSASDEQVRRYIEQLDFERDDIFGIYNRRLELIAMAHLAFAPTPSHSECAEFGVSVLEHARGRGYGARLFERACIHARNANVRMLFIHALSENTPMLKIARSAGAVVRRDGSESEAFLELAPASLDTRMAEVVEHQFAELDYRFKQQAHQFWAFLSGMQAQRSGAPGDGQPPPH